MTDYLLSRMTAGGNYFVVPRDNVRKALVRQKVDAQAPCYGSCQIQLGGAVAASKVLQSKMMRLGKECSFILDLYDVQIEAMERSVEVPGLTCDEIGLRQGISTGAARLSGGSIVDGVGLSGLEQIKIIDSGVVSEGREVDFGEKIVNTVTDEKGFLKIRTHVKGSTKDAHAMIRINGVEEKPSPIHAQKMVGEYLIAAQLDDYYHVSTKRVILGTGTVEVDLELQPAFGSLTIYADQDGSEVLINGRTAGETSRKSPYVDRRIKSGTYRVEVRRRLYKPSIRVVTVRDEQETVQSFNQEPDFGNIQVSSEPGGATVTLDGRVVGVTDASGKLKLIAELPTGTYTLRAQKDFYIPEERRVQAADGITTEAHFTLKTDFGGITVSSNPSGAGILIDDNDTGRKTPATFSPVNPGVHFVALELDGYGRSVSKVDIENGNVAQLNVELQPKLGLLSVMAEQEDGSPCEGDVLIDGRKVGAVPWKGDVLAVSHVVEVSCLEGAGAESVTVPHNGRQTVVVKIGNRGFIEISGTYEDGNSCAGYAMVDGEDFGTTPARGWVEAGNHQIKIFCDDGVGEAEVSVSRGDRKKVSVEVSGRPVASPWPWVTLGLGAGAIVGGGMLNLFADRDLDKVRQAEVNIGGIVTGMTLEEAKALELRANQMNNSAIAMYSVGSVAVLAGLIWGIVDIVDVNRTREETKAKARITGIVVPGGGGVGIAGIF